MRNRSKSLLAHAHAALESMVGETYDIFTLRKPRTVNEAHAVAKVISKLSPFTANVLEAELILVLNEKKHWPQGAKWIRQDPDFPDALLSGVPEPRPGIELKMWFPFATEITARFRETQAHLQDHLTSVALIAWLPEYLLYGQPKIVGVWIDDALSVAEARDNHYHSPPSYIVCEPEDTAARTRNLQQRNVNGFKFQGKADSLREAEMLVASWGPSFKAYSLEKELQDRVRALQRQFTYRLDTNFAKMDRIAHAGLQEFKNEIMATTYFGRSIAEWKSVISTEDHDGISKIMDLQS